MTKGRTQTNLDRPQQGTHAVSTATWLTGSAPKRTEAEDFFNVTSLDQVIANKVGQDTVFPSIEIATEDLTGYVGACESVDSMLPEFDLEDDDDAIRAIRRREASTESLSAQAPDVELRSPFGRPG